MNVLLALAGVGLPSIFKKRKIKKLLTITARAFLCDAPPLAGLNERKLLETFARFARAEGDRAIDESRDLSKIKEALYEGAFAEGTALKRTLGLKSMRDVLTTSRLFYQLLGIRFSGTETGAISINQCFFARYFSPATCRIISSLDEGMAAGLTGGMRLTFSTRITDGHAACRAVLE